MDYGNNRGEKQDWEERKQEPQALSNSQQITGENREAAKQDRSNSQQITRLGGEKEDLPRTGDKQAGVNFFLWRASFSSLRSSFSSLRAFLLCAPVLCGAFFCALFSSLRAPGAFFCALFSSLHAPGYPPARQFLLRAFLLCALFFCARTTFPARLFSHARLARLRRRLGSWARGIAVESPLGAA
jgi:hypothetical protein